ncbi:MAG: hypothetical protein MI919_24270, partial [Holophagales bacterium]|nr:hypothetical protein [Holophagales bacterium]
MKHIAALVLIVLLGTPAVDAQQATAPDLAELQETLRQRLEADRAELFAMSPEERHAYMRQFFDHPDRETRRAFKSALEQVRQEWNVPGYTGGVTTVEGPSRAEAAVKVAGSNITYDSGTVFGFGGIASQMVGNRFDSALNTAGTAIQPVETTGSITMITFNMVNTFFGSVVWSLYSNVMGTTAPQVTSMARPGIMTGLNTLAVMSPTTANAYANGTFLAGIWQFDPTMTGLALDTGTTGGQGFHGISLNDGAMGSMLATVTTGGMGVNAI